MTSQEFHSASAAGLRHHIQLLQQERATALLQGLGDNRVYMADLDDELEAARSAYVGAAVTELASLRAALEGPLRG